MLIYHLLDNVRRAHHIICCIELLMVINLSIGFLLSQFSKTSSYGSKSRSVSSKLKDTMSSAVNMIPLTSQWHKVFEWTQAKSFFACGYININGCLK